MRTLVLGRKDAGSEWDGQAWGREPIVGSDSAIPSNPSPERSPDPLRPTSFDTVVGQRNVVEQLRITVDAARKRSDALPHILFDGPPGVGKTTLASLLPKELGVELFVSSGPALARPSDLMPYLTNLSARSVLFIDEIHRLPTAVEEFIYPAMEDFRVDIVLGEGLSARTLSLPLKKFTLIGATTRSGMLSAPLRDRFKIHHHLEFYSDADLTSIVQAAAARLGVEIDEASAAELARRSRGTPRIALSHLAWSRDFATSRGDGRIHLELAREALAMQQVDEEGLDRRDRQYLDTLVRLHGGGPVGVESLAATMNIAVDTLSEEVEPFLLRAEFIVRTARGRRATTKAFSHLGSIQPRQGTLFDS